MPQLDSLESRLHLTAGYLDRGFSGDGKLSLPAEVRFSDVLATDNGSVVVAGISSGFSSSSADASSLYLRQYRKTGAIDRSFGDNGTVRMNLFAGVAPNIARPQLFTAANDRILVNNWHARRAASKQRPGRLKFFRRRYRDRGRTHHRRRR